MEYYYENVRFIILICELIFFTILLPSVFIYLYEHFKNKEKIDFKEVIINNLYDIEDNRYYVQLTKNKVLKEQNSLI